MHDTDAKILFVDDEPKLLSAVRRNLADRYVVETADSGAAGLAAIADRGPFAVIVSDMHMPEMHGGEFLHEVAKSAPESIRVMLTGDSDQHTAVAAVNESMVFRFLNKPCPTELLVRTIDRALVEHQVRKNEKELLSKTLAGSIGVLVDVLAVVNPTAFGRSAHIRSVARDLACAMQLADTWELEIAAMLCLIGCVTVPPASLERLVRRLPMSHEEKALFADHPKVGSRLLARIPRLESVARIISNQGRRLDGGDVHPPDPLVDLPLADRILKVAVDFDSLVQGGKTSEEALSELYGRDGWYDEQVLDALRASLNVPYKIRMVKVDELRDGMVLDEHVTSQSGSILVSLGREVNVAMRERLKAYVATGSHLRQPIRVRCRVPVQAVSVMNQVDKEPCNAG